MHLDRHHFQFFGNRDIHALYASLGILSFAEGIIGIFVPIFLWSIGYSLAAILTFFLLNSVAFIVASVALLPLVRRLNDTTMIAASLPFLIAYYLGLHALPTHPGLFVVLPAALAVHGLFYNVGYHAHFSGASDHAHVGREVGMRYLVSSFAQLAAPAIGGILIAGYGFPTAFTVGSAILLASALPLIRATPQATPTGVHLRTVLRSITDPTIRGFTWSGAGYAIVTSIGRVIWPLALFTTIGGLAQLGVLVTIGLVAELLTTSVAGFLSDTRRRTAVLRTAASASALVWIARPLLHTPIALGGSHLVGNAVVAMTMVAWSSQYYDIARAAPAPGAFILGRELLYHIARIVLTPILILGAWMLPTSAFFTTSFIAAGIATLAFFAAREPVARTATTPSSPTLVA